MSRHFTNDMVVNRANYVRTHTDMLTEERTYLSYQPDILTYTGRNFPRCNKYFDILRNDSGEYGELSMVFSTIRYYGGMSKTDLLKYSHYLIIPSNTTRTLQYDFHHNKPCFSISDNYFDLVIFSDEMTIKHLKKLYAMELLMAE